MAETIVIALGGNALQMQGEAPTIENQNKNVRMAAKHIAKIVKKGHRVIVTHGNGPQIGRLLLQQEQGNTPDTPAFPFDQCSALSQASIGYSIQQILKEELAKAGIAKEVATIVTQTVIDRNDPAFQNPTKPVGPFYTKEQAQVKQKVTGNKVKFAEDSGRGYRMVVPSPLPKEILEQKIIDTVAEDNVVICCGGGGIPVVIEDGEIIGTPAVIDKDRVSSLLAQKIKADKLIILTAVTEAKVNYGKLDEKSLHQVSVKELEKYMPEFAEGSMKPKVEACIDFVKNTDKTAIITTLEAVGEALETGKVGTIINK